MTTQPLTRLVGQLRQTLASSDLASRPDADLLASFMATRDPAAIEAIVLRHGPRVLGACRQVLRNETDVEDAFQATFVVLMREANTIRKGASLAHWLYGVAHRVALQARSARLRRERLEAKVDIKQAISADLSWQEACAILHEELNRLPEPNRRVLFLCYLEGMSRDEAAEQLGRTTASVKKALERGRDMLRKRLTRRGVTLTAGLLAVLSDSAKASMSSELVHATMKGTVNPSGTVRTLANATTNVPMRLNAIGAFLAASILAVGVALGISREDKPASPVKEKEAAKVDEKKSETWTYAGTVTGPDNKPIKAAKLWHFLDGKDKLRDVGESDADGKFSFEIKRSEFTPRNYYGNGRDLWSVGAVLAISPGYAVGYGHGSVTPGEKITIRMLKDDVAVEGKVQNLEGKPVAGASVRVVGLYRPKGPTLEAWHDDVKAGKLTQQLIYDHLGAFEADDLLDGVLNPLYPPVSTEKDGTFKLKGLGAERMALVRIEGEGIETEDVMVMTRAGDSVLAEMEREFDPEKPQIINGRYSVHGVRFTHTAAPSRPIAGVVRDLDTGKPVADATVMLGSAGGVLSRKPERLQTKTDADGKYRLTGAPVRRDCVVSIKGPADQPYIAANVDVPKPAGLEPIAIDMKIKRGIWAYVKVFDKTDNSVLSGEIEYFVMRENPSVDGIPTIRQMRQRKANVNDETFRVAVLPGPGIVAVRIPSQHPYITLAGPQSKRVDTLPYSFTPQMYLGHARIDPKVGDKDVKVEIGLTRGTE